MTRSEMTWFTVTCSFGHFWVEPAQLRFLTFGFSWERQPGAAASGCLWMSYATLECALWPWFVSPPNASYYMSHPSCYFWNEHVTVNHVISERVMSPPDVSCYFWKHHCGILAHNLIVRKKGFWRTIWPSEKKRVETAQPKFWKKIRLSRLNSIFLRTFPQLFFFPLFSSLELTQPDFWKNTRVEMRWLKTNFLKKILGSADSTRIFHKPNGVHPAQLGLLRSNNGLH